MQRHSGRRAKDPVRTLLRLLAYTFFRYRAAAELPRWWEPSVWRWAIW